MAAILDPRSFAPQHRDGPRPTPRHLALVELSPNPRAVDPTIRLSPDLDLSEGLIPHRALMAMVGAVLVAVALSLGVATGAFSWLVPGPSAGDGSVPAAEAGRGAVVVEQGDSYWSIARSLQPLGDVRPLVHQLQVLNRGVELQPGMAVRLPAQ